MRDRNNKLFFLSLFFLGESFTGALLMAFLTKTDCGNTEQIINREFIHRLIQGPEDSVEVYSDVILQLTAGNDYVAKYMRLALTRLPGLQISIVPPSIISIIFSSKNVRALYNPYFRTMVVSEVSARKINSVQLAEIKMNLEHEFKHAFCDAYNSLVGGSGFPSTRLHSLENTTSFTLVEEMVEKGNQRVRETLDLLRKEKHNFLTREEKSFLKELREKIAAFGWNQFPFMFVNRDENINYGSIIGIKVGEFEMKFHVDGIRQASIYGGEHSFLILRPTIDTDRLTTFTCLIDSKVAEVRQIYRYNDYFSELDAELTAWFPPELINIFYTELIKLTNTHVEQLQEMLMFQPQPQNNLGRGTTTDPDDYHKLIAATANGADDYLRGLQYYDGDDGKQPDFAKAAKYFKLAAHENNPQSQYYLGIMYLEGKGVPQDIGEAIRFFSLSAEQGHRTAQYLLGNIYLKGEYVKKDVTEAMKWLQRAADAGESRAEYVVGVSGYYGKNGMPRDAVKARSLLRDSADQGNIKATATLDQHEGGPQPFVTSSASRLELPVYLAFMRYGYNLLPYIAPKFKVSTPIISGHSEPTSASVQPFDSRELASETDSAFSQKLTAIAGELNATVNSASALTLFRPAPNNIRQQVDGDWHCLENSSGQLLCINAEMTKARIVSKASAKPWREVSGDHFSQCETVRQDSVEVKHCIGEKTEYVELDITRPAKPTLASTLGAAAVHGAVCAALPEAIGDTLYLSGIMTEGNAEKIKLVTNAAMILATGSYLATGASWVATTALKFFGCSNAQARIGGNAASFLVNTVYNFTPTGVATTAATTAISYAAGCLSLWAEKRIAKEFVEGEIHHAHSY